MAAEKIFENEIKKFLKSENCWFVKFWAGPYSKSGIPDILCVVNSIFIGIEVKAEKGKPSDLQLYNLKKINECNGIGIILYPKDFDKFKTIVKEIKSWDMSKISKVKNLVDLQF